MIIRLIDRLRVWEKDVRSRYDTDLSNPENLRKAGFYNAWLDHGILRHYWKNVEEIAPDVFRSNHPGRARLAEFRDAGVRTILNLRGESDTIHYMTEKVYCDELGLDLVNAKLNAVIAPDRDKILHLIETFRNIEKPFVMHCKSGADRAGLASAVYLLVIEGKPVAEAKKMLSLRFLHIRQSKTGVLDFILDTYEKRLEQGEIGFEDWIAQEYDSNAVQAAFDASR